MSKQRAQNKIRAGQVSLEFIIVAGFAVILLVSMLAIASQKLSTAANDATYTSMADVAASIHQEILTAQSVGEGYERTFMLPTTIQKRSYYLTIEPDGNSSVVNITTAGHSLSIRTPRCEGTLKSGANNITKFEGVIKCNP